MRAIFLFEFCDQRWVPGGARECLFEVMEVCNSGCRSFYGEVAGAALDIARREGLDVIVELGAGRAPITSRLAQNAAAADLRLVVCDLVPNEEVFRDLEASYPGHVEAIFERVDITQQRAGFGNAVLVLSGVMHHVPLELRVKVLRALSESGGYVAVFEPIRRTLLSIVLAGFSAVPALLLPLTYLRRPGRLRRFLWCWLLPIVPPMFAWDGIVSCLRQWNEAEWRAHLAEIADAVVEPQIDVAFNSTRVQWRGRAADRPAVTACETRHMVDSEGD